MAVFLLLLLVPVTMMAGCRGEEPVQEYEERSFAVETAAAHKETLAVRLELGGEIKSSRQVAIIPPIPGRVASVPVKEGQAVSRGEPLLYLENTSQKLQLQQAQAALEVLTTELDRVETLVEAGALPEKNLRELRGQITQAELARDMARYAYDQTILKSPLEGIVTGVNARAGELVATTVVMAIISQEGITAQVTVDEGQLGYLSPGMSVQVQVPAVGEVLFSGSISAVSQSAIPGSRSFPVEVELEAERELLRPGMYALVLVEKIGHRGFQVPASALLEQEGHSYLFLVQKGRVLQRTVKTGLRQSGKVEIIEGLSGGERFIIRPPARIKDGDRVEEK